MKTTDDFRDIIDHPHHVSKRHPQMSMDARSAQFAPFAALTGFGAVILERNRVTETKVELSEDMLADLNAKLRILSKSSPRCASVSYFLPDTGRAEGKRMVKKGMVRRYREDTGELLFADGTAIAIEDVSEIRLDGDDEFE